MTSKKQIMQEIIDWSRAANNSFASAADAFYNLLGPLDESKENGIVLPSGICYHEDEIDERDEFALIFSFTEKDGNKKFYKISGFYSSWDGVSWEDAEMTRVYPEAVTVIRYTTKKSN